MSNILVLSGGISSEREVSLRTGAAVAKALQSKGHNVTVHDLKDGLEGVGSYDVIFPALHGKGGEDGTIQAELDTLGIPYVGCDAAVSALCFDKWQYIQKMREGGFPLSQSEVIDASSIWQSPIAKKPFVLKPIDGGSSIDTFIVRDVHNIDTDAIDQALSRHAHMLLETLVEGIELTAGVLGDHALPIVEIIPPEDGEFDYENKYNGQTQELCPPQHISPAIQAQAQGLALRVHKFVSCRDLSRTDMIVTPTGELVILETNTLPGMTDQSLFPKAAHADGINMADLVDRLVQMALARA